MERLVCTQCWKLVTTNCIDMGKKRQLKRLSAECQAAWAATCNDPLRCPLPSGGCSYEGGMTLSSLPKSPRLMDLWAIGLERPFFQPVPCTRKSIVFFVFFVKSHIIVMVCQNHVGMQLATGASKLSNHYVTSSSRHCAEQIDTASFAGTTDEMFWPDLINKRNTLQNLHTTLSHNRRNTWTWIR